MEGKMNKENKSAAGLRRSAIVERIRLREEWSELKGRESQPTARQKHDIMTKKQTNMKTASGAKDIKSVDRCRKPSARNTQQTENVLCGVVALVEVGSESRALPLRAALGALGASVLPSWSPLVTHLVWSQGGCRSTRARARALASRLVSPLWVEACAAASRRLPEQAFPAAARPSDLPSPRTLQRLLKKAEMENIPIADLLSDSTDENQKQLRLRISSETERDTSLDTDTSRDVSRDTSTDISNDRRAGVKTQEKPQRAIPTRSEAPPTKSRRKLFTQKEPQEEEDSEDSGENTPISKARKPSYKPAGVQRPKPPRPGLQPGPGLRSGLQVDRKELARAERLAKKIITGCTPAMQHTRGERHRIVLTGMSRSERRVVSEAVRALKGRLQASVDKTTTHVLVGTFLHDEEFNRTMTGIPTLPSTELVQKQRTLSALCGAARGCRVLAAQWALNSRAEGRWLHHYGYEVPHLKKISEKARLERSAWRKVRCEYAYDVFCEMRVRVTRDAPQRDAAVMLLKLCGAVVQEGENCDGRNRIQKGVLTQNGGLTQNGVQTQNGAPTLTQNGGRKDPSQYYVTQRPECEYDVRIGCSEGEVTTKWVFDSVAAGRMRNTRRYLVSDPIYAQMERLGC